MIVDFCRQKRKVAYRTFIFKKIKQTRWTWPGYLITNCLGPNWGSDQSDIRLQYISEYALKLLIIVDSKTHFYRQKFKRSTNKQAKRPGRLITNCVGGCIPDRQGDGVTSPNLSSHPRDKVDRQTRARPPPKTQLSKRGFVCGKKLRLCGKKVRN